MIDTLPNILISIFSVPVIEDSSTDVTVSSASGIVTFRSHPIYETVHIFVIQQNVNGLTLPPALVNGSADNNEIFWTVSELGEANDRRYCVNLTIPDLREHHLYNRYLISVQNSVGNADVDIKFEFPSLGL